MIRILLSLKKAGRLKFNISFETRFRHLIRRSYTYAAQR